MTGGLFAILDDIAALLDDAAVMSKVAAKKTAGLLGDDLAVNAEKATGFRASRELPVLWAITKGSFVNKLIILPLAMLMSAYVSWLIVPILLLGGGYLSYEGMEKIFHSFSRRHHDQPTPEDPKAAQPGSLADREKAKIRSAVRTDFILSIEIIMIALGTVIDEPLVIQVMVVSLIAVLATVGVYGLVALIVRMDDAGFYLIRQAAAMTSLLAAVSRTTGRLLVRSLPLVIRALAIIGTIAMLLVGGGMFTHNLHALHHAAEVLPAALLDLLVGTAVGTALVLSHLLIARVRS